MNFNNFLIFIFTLFYFLVFTQILFVNLVTLKTIIENIIFERFIYFMKHNANPWVFNGHNFPLSLIFVDLLQMLFEQLNHFNFVLDEYLFVEQYIFVKVVDFVRQDIVGLKLLDKADEFAEIYYYFFSETVIMG